MSELSKYLVEQILLEDKNPIKKIVVVYAGRFQPFHKGHYTTYQNLVKKFGKDSVFIGTSNKVEKPKSPFNFKDKVNIMKTMFGIPTNKIVEVKNPYQPTEVLKKFDESSTAFITVVGEKDKSRLGGKYFTPYKGEPTEGYKDRGYVYVSPAQTNAVIGTVVRIGLGQGSDEQKQNFFVDTAYPKFNKTIFNLITSKLNEGIYISKERIEDWLINESSVGGPTQEDDGPTAFFPNFDVFSKISAKRAAKIGYEVVDMIMSKEIEDYYEHPNYPQGPVKAVSYFPAGVIGAKTPNNQIDIYSSGAYTQWFKHATRKATLTGYQLVSTPQTKQDFKDDKKQSGDAAKGDLKLKDEFENSLQEAITLPIEIGDTLLMGKFKNKKVVVKSIGTDEHGLPTINGKKVVTFRYVNESFIVELAGTEIKCEKCNHQWDIESDDSEKYLCHSCGWDSQKQEYDFDAFDSWREKMGLDESVDEAGGKLRPSAIVRRKFALAGKGPEIARARQRTMLRRKNIDKLKKIAYKMAYRQVYDEFAKELFPDIPKSELSVLQSKVVHRNVLRKKKRVLKRARFKFLPDLRDKETEKFTQKNEQLAKGMSLRDISDKHGVSFEDIKKEAEKGVKVEMEHTSDTNVAYNIAKDHIFEDPKYYTKLATIEKVDELMIGYPSEEDMKQIEKRVQKQRSNTDSNKEYQYDVVKENIESNLSNKYKVDIDIYEYPDRLELKKIVVPKEQRSGGIGTKVMQDLIKYAEANKKDLFTTPDSTFGGSKPRLVQFYKSFGFKPNKGSNRDFRSIESMVRLSEGVELEKLGITDFKSLFKKMPSDLQKRVFNLKNFGQRLDKHPEGIYNTQNYMKDSIERLLEDMDNHIVEMFLPTTKSSQQLIKENINESELLMEGGAYGHMNHPFDTEINLTFGQLKDIVNRALEGTLEFTREKCVYGEAIIKTEKNGEMTLKEFVDSDVDDRVLSYDEITQKNEFKSVMAKLNNDDTGDWLEIELDDGKVIQVTPNHRIYVDGIGYIQAKDLTEDMELKIV